MASIGQLKLPDNNNYNLSVPFVIGTGSTAGTWLGTLTGLTAYYDGLLILYKPSVAGASTTTLNLNSLGAKTCYINNATKLTTHFPVNQPILLAYSTSQNSGCWMCIDNYWTNSVPSASCGTAAATAAKGASCDFYMANANSYVHIVMRYSNTSKTALTLNINSKGAKPIYINGTASSASNYTLPAGSYIIFYDGTNYYFRTDGKLTANITGNAGTVNGHTVAKDVPSNAKFTDTTYESKSAASGGTDVSLCTTGEKYTWNNKMDKTNPSGSGTFSFDRKSGSNIGQHSVAIGLGSEARGHFSVAIGSGTIAKNAGQHVIGRYNIEDPGSSEPSTIGTYLEIVGNGGGSSSRSNARTLDWHGNEVLAGGLKINGTQDVATTADILPNYWSLFSDLNTSNTIKTLNVVSGRKISNFAVLFAIVIRGGGERTSTIIPAGRFVDGIWVSLTEVDSANTQRWYEIKYVDDEHVKVQCSSNATGSEVHIYGLGTNSTY